jgi:NTP pyrophosphatase (non-canonical NTP hydrolase)
MDKIVEKIYEVTNKYEMKSLDQIVIKTGEELGEFNQAILSYEKAPGCAYKNKTLENVTEEAVDTMINLFSALGREGVPLEDIKSMFYKKIDKWIVKAEEEKQKLTK